MHHINNPVIIQNWAGERNRKNVLLSKPELVGQAGGKVLKLSEFVSGTTHSFSPFIIFHWIFMLSPSCLGLSYPQCQSSSHPPHIFKTYLPKTFQLFLLQTTNTPVIN